MGKDDRQREEFLDTFDKFDSLINEAHTALESGEPDETAAAAGLILDSAVADNNDLVHHLEEVLRTWCKQVEHVLAESKQMRKEADNVGPRAELEHWKQRMAKFNGLLDQIKSHECAAVIGVLQFAKSRQLEQ